jgi:hypothetical protein
MVHVVLYRFRYFSAASHSDPVREGSRASLGKNRLPEMPVGLKNKFVARVKRCSILAASMLYSLSMWWPASRRKALDNKNTLRKGMVERECLSWQMIKPALIAVKR